MQHPLLLVSCRARVHWVWQACMCWVAGKQRRRPSEGGWRGVAHAQAHGDIPQRAPSCPHTRAGPGQTLSRRCGSTCSGPCSPSRSRTPRARLLRRRIDQNPHPHVSRAVQGAERHRRRPGEPQLPQQQQQHLQQLWGQQRQLHHVQRRSPAASGAPAERRLQCALQGQGRAVRGAAPAPARGLLVGWLVGSWETDGTQVTFDPTDTDGVGRLVPLGCRASLALGCTVSASGFVAS